MMWTKDKVEELLDVNGITWEEVVEILRHIGYVRIPVDYKMEMDEQYVFDFALNDDDN